MVKKQDPYKTNAEQKHGFKQSEFYRHFLHSHTQYKWQRNNIFFEGSPRLRSQKSNTDSWKATKNVLECGQFAPCSRLLRPFRSWHRPQKPPWTPQGLTEVTGPSWCLYFPSRQASNRLDKQKKLIKTSYTLYRN